MYDIDPSDYEFQTCRKCGATNDASLLNCRKCGTDLSKSNEFLIPIWAVVGAVVLIFLFAVITVTGVVFEEAVLVGFFLLIVAAGLAIVGGIWFYVEAFRVNVVWGLACLFIPFASLAFLFIHPGRAFKPFAISMAGVFIYFTATFFMPV